MKLLLDMNIPIRYVGLLKEKGFELIHWSDIGNPRASDHQIVDYAREHGFIVVTYDLDFSAILSVTHDLKPSVVQVRAALPRAAQIVDLIAIAISQNRDSLQSGAILTIDTKKARARLLPL